MPAKAFFSVGSGAGTYFWMASTRVNTRNPAYRDIDALIDSERRFRLLVEGVIDYAIYMLDPNGIVTNWNAGARADQGLRGRRNHRPAFQHLLHARRTAPPACPPRRSRPPAREGKFEAEGWRVRKDGTRFWASVVIDPIYDETATWSASPRSPATSPSGRRRRTRCRTASATSGCWSAASPTTPSTCSIPTGIVSSWNAGGERIKGYTPTEIIGQHFSRFYTDAGPGRRPPGAGAAIARETGRYEEEGWRVRKDGIVLLGQRRHRSDPRRRRQADRLRQDHPRHHRAPRGAAGARAGSAAACRVAEDGRARPAHRRRGARLQQSADGRDAATSRR